MTDMKVYFPPNDEGGDEVDENCRKKFLNDCIELAAEGTDVNTNCIEGLIKLWTDFYTRHSSGLKAATDECFETLLTSTSRIIFSLKYSTCVPTSKKEKLKRAVSECGESSHPDSPQSILCQGISAILMSPWAGKLFTSAIGCEKKTDNAAAENLWNAEGRVMLETRLEYLGRLGKKAANQMCSILHILVMKIRDALGDEVEGIQSLANSPYQPYGYPSEKYCDYLCVYGMLCFQKNFNEEVLDGWDERILLQIVSSMKKNIAVDPVNGMFSKLVKWENVKKGTSFLARKATWKALKSTTTTHLEELFQIWMEISNLEDQDSSKETCPVDEILIHLDKVHSSEYLYRLANMFEISVGLPFANRWKFVELFLAAMQMDMSTIEKLKNSAKDESEVIGKLEKCLSLRFLELAKAFAESPRIAGGCLLTAFSLKPCSQIYTILFPDNTEGIDIDNDADVAPFIPFVDFMELCSISYDFETDYENSEDADLPPALLDDLRNLISNPQYKGFVGRNPRTTIEEKCRKLLESKSIAVIENRTLDHLELDYDKYKHLKPQYDSDDDGIEKGYRKGEKLGNRRIHFRSNQVKRSIKYPKALERGLKVLPLRMCVPKENSRLPKRNIQIEPPKKRKRLSEAPMIPNLKPNCVLCIGPGYQTYGPTPGGRFYELFQTFKPDPTQSNQVFKRNGVRSR